MKKLRPFISLGYLFFVNLYTLSSEIDRGRVRRFSLLTSRRGATLEDRYSVFLLTAMNRLVTGGVNTNSIFGIEGLRPMRYSNICLLIFFRNTAIELIAHLRSLKHPMLSSCTLLGSRGRYVVT